MPEIHLDPSDFPIDEQWSPKPNKIYVLHSAGGFSKVAHVLDVTSSVVLEVDPGITSDDILIKAEAVAKDLQASNTPPLLEVHRRHWYSSNLQFYNVSGSTIGELSSSILTHGIWRFRFPPDSDHSTHEIEMKPTGIRHPCEMFVQNDAIYFWEMQGSLRGTLSKVVEGKRVHIGYFAVKNASDEDCIFVLDTQQLDELVGLMSCIALLNQIDSFNWAWGEPTYRSSLPMSWAWA